MELLCYFGWFGVNFDTVVVVVVFHPLAQRRRNRVSQSVGVASWMVR